MSRDGTPPLPWDAVLRFALGHLRWTPDAVWRATPREIAFAMPQHAAGSPALRRAEFDDLLRRFPDHASPTEPSR